MLKTIRQAWKVEALRKKMLFTLLVIVLFRLGNAITVPFINTDLLKTQMDIMNSTAFGLINMMSGGAFAMAKLFALGIQPYINASIIIQLLCVAIPSLEDLSKNAGEIGKKKIKTYTYIATFFIAILQAFGYYTIMKRYNLLTDTVSSILECFVICLCLIIGAGVLTFLGAKVEKHGIGNGISIILFAGIISRLPSAIMSSVSEMQTWYQVHTRAITVENLVSAGLTEANATEYINSVTQPWQLVLMLIGAAALILLIIYVYDIERRIPVQYAAPSGKRMASGRKTFMPFKISMAGVLPIIFAQSILSLPLTIWAFIGTPAEGTIGYTIYAAISSYSWVYILLYFVLIIAFSYFYNSIQCNPIEIANNLKANGGFIPGFRPGNPTVEIIKNALKWTTLFGAIYLAIIAIAPLLASNLNQSSSIAIGGTSVIIVVSVAIETAKALDSQLSLYNYSGFLP